MEVEFFGFGEDGDGDEGGVDAALGFGGGHALDAVSAAFEAESGVGVGALDGGDDFFETAEVGGAGVELGNFPADGFGIAGVHAVEFGGEEGGFFSAGAGADFDDGVAVGGGFVADGGALDAVADRGEFLFEFGEFELGEFSEFGVGVGVGDDGAGLAGAVTGGAPLAEGEDEFSEASVVAEEGGVELALGDDFGV